MTQPSFTLTVEDRIGTMVFDLPDHPVNVFKNHVKDEFEKLIDQVASDSSIRALVLISGKPGVFIAGADIDEFVKLQTAEQALQLVRGGQVLLERIANLGKPIVAAIHGTCLGGGLETALACTYRVATDHPSTKLGLPEVKLGVIPALGGCQRLPRVTGLLVALDMILNGKQVKARQAYRRGIVDEVVHPTVLADVATKAAKKLANGWKPKRARGISRVLIDGNPLGRAVARRQAEATVRKKVGSQYPAPLAAIDSIMHGLSKGVKAGLDREAELFAELAVGDVSRNLVQLFFAGTALAKDPGVENAPEPRTVQNLGVIGAGFMGAGIGGTAVARAKADVRFRDANQEGIQSGLKEAHRIVRQGFKRRAFSKFDYERRRALLSGGTGWAGFKRADLVIEAVFEDLGVKREVFAELEAECSADCILASNTSTIPIGQIAEGLKHRDRVLGMHFFSPVDKMPLLEVIATEQTSAEAIVTATSFGKRMGKTVIVVADHPGFWVNRILSPYMNEAGRMLEEGVPVDQIDGAMTRFGMPIGPVGLLDQVGIDVAHHASHVMHDAFGDRMQPRDGIARVLDAGRKGRKNGLGFYRYKKGRSDGVDETVYDLLKIEPQPVPPADVQARLVFAMLNEAVLALDEGVIKQPRDGDLGAIYGIGFPPYVGGPLRYLQSFGIARAVDTLGRLETAYGARFSAAPLLRRMAEDGDSFYPVQK
jgi:3-hydroxyacyl-CoA dehydrogenase/enoyl-CoA hydratase/3-hydroxybutyryl-CoA epimerase